MTAATVCWVWNLRRRKTAPAREPISDLELVTRIVHEHLEPDVAERWLTLLRPALHLVPLRAEAAPVARLGGTPNLPLGQPWPTWEGAGPLMFVGELDLAEVAKFQLDITVPTTGRLLFFFYDGSYDNFASLVGYWEPGSLAGARMLYVPDDVPSAHRPAPERVVTMTEVAYGGKQIVTAPDFVHPGLQAAFAPGLDYGEWIKHPVCADAFVEALFERNPLPRHQVGGYAMNLQQPVESEVAWGVLGGDSQAIDMDAAAREASRWRLLFQVDSDDNLNMMWGDAGALYWLARTEDLDAGDISHYSFTWQCL